jgi:translation initiation factor IF-1
MENAKEKVIQAEGVVLEALPSATFKIKIDNGGEIVGYLSGKMRMYSIKISAGDRVAVEMSPYDNTKGRIVKRY